MGLFDKADRNHPIYGSSFIGPGSQAARTPKGLAPLILQAAPDAEGETETVAQVRALLDGGADVNAPDPDGVRPLQAAAQRGWSGVVAVLLAAGADPLAGQKQQEAWPMFLAANAGHSDSVLALLPATVAAYYSTLQEPAHQGEAVWLEPAWQIDLGDVERGQSELLLGVRDKFSGEVGSDLYALILGDYRVYYERVVTSIVSFGGPPVARGIVRQDMSDPDVHDRQAVERSCISGYLSDASVILDANFQGDVEPEMFGTFADADLFE